MFETLNARVTVLVVVGAVLTTTVVIGTEQWLHAGQVRADAVARYGDVTAQAMQRMARLGRTATASAVNRALSEAVEQWPEVTRLSVTRADGVVVHASDQGELGAKHSVGASDAPVVAGASDEFFTIGGRLGPGQPRACGGCHQAREIGGGGLVAQIQTTENVARHARELYWVVAAALLVQVPLFTLLWLLLQHRLVAPARAVVEFIDQGFTGEELEVEPGWPQELRHIAEHFHSTMQELRKAKANLEAESKTRITQADRLAAVGELAMTISHEVKNRLAGQLATLATLRDQPELSGHREIIDELVLNQAGLEKAVRELLEQGRPAEPQLVRCDINEIAKGAISFFRKQCDLRGIRVTREVHSSLYAAGTHRATECLCAPRDLELALLNVCLNGIEAMPDGGTLTVRASVVASSGGPQVRLRVHDTGSGITEQAIAKVFDPFFTTKSTGTGLGLAISKRLLEESGGSIRISSLPGKGTTVDLDVPVVPRVCAEDPACTPMHMQGTEGP